MLVPSPCFKCHRTFRLCYSDNCWHPCYYSRPPSVCLVIPRAKLGRCMYGGVIGKVGTTMKRIAERRSIPQVMVKDVRVCAPHVLRCMTALELTRTEFRGRIRSRGGRGQQTLLSKTPLTAHKSLHQVPSAQPPQPRFSTIASSLGPGEAPLRAPSHANSLNASRRRLLSRHSKHLPKLHGTASKASKTRPRAASCLG